jgi:hypothetical protein
LPWATTSFPASRSLITGQSESKVGASSKSAVLIPWTRCAAQAISRSECKYVTNRSPTSLPGTQLANPNWTGTSVCPRAAPADSKSMAVKQKSAILTWAVADRVAKMENPRLFLIEKAVRVF